MKEYKTRALTIKVRPDGIIEMHTNEGWDQPDTVEIAKENIEMLIKAVDNKPRALLSYMPSTYMSKEVLDCYDKAEIGEVASAMLTTSFGAKVMGNAYLKLTGKAAKSSQIKNQAPVRIFSKKEDAVVWLLSQIAKHQ
ncbi:MULTISPECIES: hypothetical protein [unclassified Aureispira]|uniref:hypothetical protein n=1 Tax=unclassified Aureispira TaxID=2649989 RepID=UPI00069898CB|nr:MULTISPECIES: hypothetical protein [unclassified Aureispira]WMX12898.1 hypothetical protein QP953_18845 [Aureispira sp. CCB-E]